MSFMFVGPIVKEHLLKHLATLLVDEVVQLDQVDALADQHSIVDDIGADSDRDQKDPWNKCRQCKFSACFRTPSVFGIRQNR